MPLPMGYSEMVIALLDYISQKPKLVVEAEETGRTVYLLADYGGMVGQPGVELEHGQAVIFEGLCDGEHLGLDDER